MSRSSARQSSVPKPAKATFQVMGTAARPRTPPFNCPLDTGVLTAVESVATVGLLPGGREPCPRRDRYLRAWQESVICDRARVTVSVCSGMSSPTGSGQTPGEARRLRTCRVSHRVRLHSPGDDNWLNSACS
jgi:hypothetical protein